jgi:3-oxoacyl-[acyl-carrier-protein] synthase II
MKAIIKASSVISPQHTHSAEGFPSVINEVISDRLTCLEPDYRNLINPIQLRRMPRILKMGLAASQLCISRAGGVDPDAIIVGTGLGCLDNLEKFLLEVIDNQERITSVLPFINSTHNAVAAQVAMLLKNHNYNITYCHRAFSFESALQDALMQIEEKQAQHVLVGGIDECTHDYVKLHGYLGYWKKPLSNLQLLGSGSSGTIAGEGASFFMVSGQPDKDVTGIILQGIHTFLTPQVSDLDSIEHEITWFLRKCRTELQDIDGVLLGLNGDNHFDQAYYALQKGFFPDQTIYMGYKHLCGEYYTATAFALWLGFVTLKSQQIPDAVNLTRIPDKPVKNLLLYNNFRNTEHSLILLKNGAL